MTNGEEKRPGDPKRDADRKLCFDASLDALCLCHMRQRKTAATLRQRSKLLFLRGFHSHRVIEQPRPRLPPKLALEGVPAQSGFSSQFGAWRRAWRGLFDLVLQPPPLVEMIWPEQKLWEIRVGPFWRSFEHVGSN